MNGIGILKGLWVTFCHFIETFLVDLRSGSKRYFTETGIKSRLSADTDGIFTIQYPEEKMPVPENFRYLPFLVYRETESGEKKPLCTACGICTKVCPPQCISIKKAIDPETGKAISSPAEFFIDIDICMNCGLCAEYCPFDAIKMDHDYEIATQTRDNNLYDLQKLMKPMAYYAKIRPSYYATEEAARREKELKKNQ
ncbi:MAG: 4Fe-4S dicluster domain-containing protein [Anaerolineae bacterium]|nr:4Fe-4S dicluster domain-containing protein [Anaerolineae bacterium]